MQTKAANIITDKPYKLWLKAPLFLRLIFIKRVPVFITPLRLMTMVHISKQLDKLEKADAKKMTTEPVPEGFKIIQKDARTMSRIIAYAMLNRWYNIWFSGVLSFYLYRRLTSQELSAIVSIVLIQANIKSFLSTIISLAGLNILSPKEEMSPNGTGEIIAPGVSQEA